MLTLNPRRVQGKVQVNKVTLSWELSMFWLRVMILLSIGRLALGPDIFTLLDISKNEKAMRDDDSWKKEYIEKNA